MAVGDWIRPLRRLLRPFLNKAERERIGRLIGEMEAKTTGEIHVHVMGRTGGRDMLDLARDKFRELGLDKTSDRDGVLILISDLDHRFAVWADEGIHAKAGQETWDEAVRLLRSHFTERRYAEGIEACVREVGRHLALHFPQTRGPDPNQLPDLPTES